jgi:Tfp pilus assembly protein PilX
MVKKMYNINNIKMLKNQQGVVLIVSLVFLIALTAVAAALMQNTTTDMKMSGASEDKVFAEQCAVSAVDDYVFQQVNGATNALSRNVNTFDDEDEIVSGALTSTKKKCDIKAATLALTNNAYKREVPCKRDNARNASSIQVFDCNYLRIKTNIKYGRNKTSVVEVNSGVLKEVLKN